MVRQERNAGVIHVIIETVLTLGIELTQIAYILIARIWYCKFVRFYTRNKYMQKEFVYIHYPLVIATIPR